MMFSYTSGTTGDPKGVKLSHKMLVMSGAAVNMKMGKFKLTHDDSYISYLPLAHSFEQALFAMACVCGMRVGYFGGDVTKMVAEDLPLLKPTFFPSVPRLYNKIYGKIQDKLKLATGCKAVLVSKAVASKYAALRSTGAVTNGCWDAIVFKKMKALVGG
jgi:long-chain acyl-CoA synthetase